MVAQAQAQAQALNNVILTPLYFDFFKKFMSLGSVYNNTALGITANFADKVFEKKILLLKLLKKLTFNIFNFFNLFNLFCLRWMLDVLL